MKIARVLLSAALLTNSVLLVHCAAKGDDPKKSPRESSCETICGKASSCDLVDSQECQQMCVSDLFVSEASLGIIEHCSSSSSCADLYTRRFQDCLLGGFDKLSATESAVERCESERAWTARCPDDVVEPFDYGECLSQAKLYSDDYLSEDALCLEDTCSRVASCRSRVRDLFVGDGSILLAAVSGYGDSGGSECCAASDPCGYAENGACDCPTQPWDAADCEDTSEVCCEPSDPCNWANDDACDCEGTQDWDAADCEDADCCADGDPCSLANDGTCDCEGNQAWDAVDCGLIDCCTADNLCDFDNDDICDCEGTQPWDAADCEGPATSCCHSSNPCNWEEDGFCDCNGTQPWDAVDCQCCDAENSCGWDDDQVCDCPWLEWDIVDCTGGDPCCGPTDLCSYAEDNVCDCAQPWDAVDCTL